MIFCLKIDKSEKSNFFICQALKFEMNNQSKVFFYDSKAQDLNFYLVKRLGSQDFVSQTFGFVISSSVKSSSSQLLLFKNENLKFLYQSKAYILIYYQTKAQVLNYFNNFISSFRSNAEFSHQFMTQNLNMFINLKSQVMTIFILKSSDSESGFQYLSAQTHKIVFHL